MPSTWSRRTIPGSGTATPRRPRCLRLHVRSPRRGHRQLQRQARSHAIRAGFLQDYGGPIGFRLALAHPDRVQLCADRAECRRPRRRAGASLWETPPPILGPTAPNMRRRCARTSSRAPRPACVTSERALRPRITTRICGPTSSRFCGAPAKPTSRQTCSSITRTNVASYPAWQQWLRAHQPPLLVTWGRYDPSFEAAEAAAYKRDVPGAEVHLLDGGHFALEEQADQIADLTRDFLVTQLGGTVTTSANPAYPHLMTTAMCWAIPRGSTSDSALAGPPVGGRHRPAAQAGGRPALTFGAWMWAAGRVK